MKKLSEFCRRVNVSTTTPAYRVLILIANSTARDPATIVTHDDHAVVANDGLWDDSFLKCPVVAIESRIEETWTKPQTSDSPAFPSAPTPELLLADGWRFRDARTVRDALFVLPYGNADEDCGGEPLSIREYQEWSPCDAYTLVACAWKPEEDDKRLAGILRRLKSRSRHLAIFRRGGED